MESLMTQNVMHASLCHMASVGDIMASSVKIGNCHPPELVYRARPLSRFRITGSNRQGRAKKGLAEGINIHSRLTNQIN